MNATYRFLHHHLLKIMLLAYGIAIFFPGPGQALREIGATVVGKGSAFELT